jgi:hypothetical protein
MLNFQGPVAEAAWKNGLLSFSLALGVDVAGIRWTVRSGTVSAAVLQSSRIPHGWAKSKEKPPHDGNLPPPNLSVQSGASSLRDQTPIERCSPPRHHRFRMFLFKVTRQSKGEPVLGETIRNPCRPCPVPCTGINHLVNTPWAIKQVARWRLLLQCWKQTLVISDHSPNQAVTSRS